MRRLRAAWPRYRKNPKPRICRWGRKVSDARTGELTYERKLVLDDYGARVLPENADYDPEKS